MLTGFLLRRKGLLLLLGDYPIRQLVLCEKDFGWMALWKLNPEALADGLCDLGGGGITSAEGHHDWGRRAVPLLNFPLAFALQLRKARKTSVMVAE
jgi:hypothetical protein